MMALQFLSLTVGPSVQYFSESRTVFMLLVVGEAPFPTALGSVAISRKAAYGRTIRTSIRFSTSIERSLRVRCDTKSVLAFVFSSRCSTLAELSLAEMRSICFKVS